MKYAIYGADSIGIVLGASISKAGYDIDIITDSKPILNALKINGAHVKGTLDFITPVGTKLLESLTGSYDIIFVCGGFSKPAKELLELYSMLTDNGVIVTLQPGFPEASYAEFAEKARVVCCVPEFGAYCTAPGVSELTTDPQFMSIRVVKNDEFPDAVFEEVKTLLATAAPVYIEEDLTSLRWSKLAVTAPVSGLATVLGCRYSELLADSAAKQIVIRCMKECFDVAAKADIQFALIQGKNPAKLFNYDSNFKCKLALRRLSRALKHNINTFPQMLQDINAGKKSSVNEVNGIICAMGKIHNIPTPINNRLVESIKIVESGVLKPAMKNVKIFDDLVND